MKFVKLIKSGWNVEKINENDWTIKSPDGMYKDENGKEYHFKTKEDALEELDYLRAEHKFDKKSADNNILSQGDFIDNSGTWKRVLDKTIETSILDQIVNIELWHYEIETEDERLQKDFSPSTQHFTITNAKEISENISKAFEEELSRQFGKKIHWDSGYSTTIIDKGQFY